MANIIRHPVGCKQYGLLHIFMGKLSQFPLVDVKRTPTSGKSIMPTKGVRLPIRCLRARPICGPMKMFRPGLTEAAAQPIRSDSPDPAVGPSCCRRLIVG